MNLFESNEIKELSEALSKAQAEMPIAEKNSSNPFFKSKYADFQTIVESSRPCLTKYGLSVSQQIVQNEHEGPYLVTKLRHASGQWIMSQVKITPAKNDIQSISSYVTYLKRMCYSSLVGVVTGEVDDDGEASVASFRAPEPKAVAIVTDYIDEDQMEHLKSELIGFPDTEKIVFDGMERLYKTRSFDKLPKSKFYESLDRIKMLKLEEKKK